MRHRVCGTKAYLEVRRADGDEAEGDDEKAEEAEEREVIVYDPEPFLPLVEPHARQHRQRLLARHSRLAWSLCRHLGLHDVRGEHDCVETVAKKWPDHFPTVIPFDKKECASALATMNSSLAGLAEEEAGLVREIHAENCAWTVRAASAIHAFLHAPGERKFFDDLFDAALPVPPEPSIDDDKWIGWFRSRVMKRMLNCDPRMGAHRLEKLETEVVDMHRATSVTFAVEALAYLASHWEKKFEPEAARLDRLELEFEREAGGLPTPQFYAVLDRARFHIAGLAVQALEDLLDEAKEWVEFRDDTLGPLLAEAEMRWLYYDEIKNPELTIANWEGKGGPGSEALRVVRASDWWKRKLKSAKMGANCYTTVTWEESPGDIRRAFFEETGSKEAKKALAPSEQRKYFASGEAVECYGVAVEAVEGEEGKTWWTCLVPTWKTLLLKPYLALAPYYRTDRDEKLPLELRIDLAMLCTYLYKDYLLGVPTAKIVENALSHHTVHHALRGQARL